VNEEAIGRVKSVWVSRAGAVISNVLAIKNEKSNAPQLSFKGPVGFSDSVKKHLTSIVHQHVNEILKVFNISLSSYSLSLVNIGAASTSGVPILITGYSLDISVFLALISASLKLPIRQNILFTGHIGSIEGDIFSVEKLAEKCEAAIEAQNITEFVYPDIDLDLSLKNITPREFEKATIALCGSRGKIKLHPTTNTLELFEKAIDSHAIVLSAFKAGYFNKNLLDTAQNNIQKVAQFLNTGNLERFWKSLEESIFQKKAKQCHELMNEYVSYFIRHNLYPSDFGKQLLQLSLSVPRYLKTDQRLFPLLVREKYIQLIQFAQKSDLEDISYLHDALYGDSTFEKSPIEKKKKSVRKKTNAVLEHIIQQLDPDYIERTINHPYDEARACYTVSSITVKNNDQFIETVTTFYTHLYRHVNKIKEALNKNELASDTIAILEKTFKQKKGYNEALIIALEGTKGGLRFIFDQMTDHLKEEATLKHSLKTFKENIDPLDFKNKVEIINQIMKYYAQHLSEDLLLEPAEKYVENYEQLIQEYVKSKYNLNNTLQRL